MKLEAWSLPKLIGTNLRITSAVILCFSAYLSIPKIVDSTYRLSSLPTKSFNRSSNRSFANVKAKPQDSQDIYVPPNYGGPDSQHGSGTR
ncbi:MAG: hypothetical protein KME23_23435 [Goleter apudmare HA4340-LM2]|jgi:hypothetical protein|nr:hypothetical protein [Goleter apudmare HA4340-LM2]